MLKIVFIFAEYSLHNHIIESYIHERPEDQISIIKVPLVLKSKSRVDTASRILPKLSKRFIADKLFEYFIILFVTLLPKFLTKGAVFRRLKRIATKNKIPYHKSTNIISPETIEFIKKQNPDLIITMFHQIITDELITIPTYGIINLHPGLIPDFKGIQPYFWELSEGSERAGVSMHLIVDQEIDSGPLLSISSYKIPPRISVQLNYFLTTLSAAKVLPECIRLFIAGELSPKAQTTNQGSYYKWPDSEAYNRLKKSNYSVISLKDIYAILTGKYDNFSPDEITYFRK
ncbi:MAG: hypothetical protein KBC84_07045 [Proteobacteria bacterium]|nr:hypothetical protein [Pseudomonadota bacterium]